MNYVLPPQISKYQLIKKLGGGQFGEVHLAHDQALGCNTAIKLIKVDDVSKIPDLIREAQIMYSCKHKHVVEIREADVLLIGADHYLIFGLEYLPEGSIEGEMNRRWISQREACIRTSHVLAGLQYAHSQGFLHRDIKPGNILINGDSTKLSDFGLAATTSFCVPGMMSYHPHNPPEYYASLPPNHSFDIYAIGITLFRIANNYANWKDRLALIANPGPVLQKGRLIPVIGYENFLSPRLKRIINKACNSEPSKRYQDATSMKDDIDSIRFGIEWIRHSVGKWAGTLGQDSFTAEIIANKNKFTLEYKKNGRRVSPKNSDYATFDDANNALMSFVSDESVI